MVVVAAIIGALIRTLIPILSATPASIAVSSIRSIIAVASSGSQSVASSPASSGMISTDSLTLHVKILEYNEKVRKNRKFLRF